MMPRRNLLRHPSPIRDGVVPGRAACLGFGLGLILMGALGALLQEPLQQQGQAWRWRAQTLQGLGQQQAQRLQAWQHQRSQIERRARQQVWLEQVSRGQQEILQVQEALMQLRRQTPVRIIQGHMDEKTWQWQALAPDPASVALAQQTLQMGTPLTWTLSEWRHGPQTPGDTLEGQVSWQARRTPPAPVTAGTAP